MAGTNFTTVTLTEARQAIPGILRQFGMRPNFPIQLGNVSSAYYMGARMETTMVFNHGRIDGASITYIPPLYLEPLYFEIGHIKLKCLGLPSYNLLVGAQNFMSYVHVLHDEFYDDLILNHLFPDISRRIMSEKVQNLPSQAQASYEAANIPPIRTPLWFQGIPRILMLIQNCVSCSRSAGLSTQSSSFQSILSIFRATNLGGLIASVESKMNSLPQLPIRRRFSQREGQAIVSTVEQIFDAIFDNRASTFPLARYKIKCRNFWPLLN